MPNSYLSIMDISTIICFNILYLSPLENDTEVDLRKRKMRVNFFSKTISCRDFVKSIYIEMSCADLRGHQILSYIAYVPLMGSLPLQNEFASVELPALHIDGKHDTSRYTHLS